MLSLSIDLLSMGFFPSSSPPPICFLRDSIPPSFQTGSTLNQDGDPWRIPADATWHWRPWKGGNRRRPAASPPPIWRLRRRRTDCPVCGPAGRWCRCGSSWPEWTAAATKTRMKGCTEDSPTRADPDSSVWPETPAEARAAAGKPAGIHPPPPPPPLLLPLLRRLPLYRLSIPYNNNQLIIQYKSINLTIGRLIHSKCAAIWIGSLLGFDWWV